MDSAPKVTPELLQQPDDRRQMPQQHWSFALFAMLVTASIVIISLAVPALFNPLLTSDSSGLGGGDGVPPEGASATASWIHLLLFQATVVLLTIVMAPVAPGSGTTLGWQPPVGRNRWLQPLLLTIAVSIVTSIIAFTFFADIVARDLAPIRQMILTAPLWLAFVALAIGAPLSEELLFRGYLLHRLRQTRLGFIGATLIANTGWTLLHVGYSWLSLTDVFLAGLLFSWALWRTKSIWVPIAFHAAYNAIVFFVLLLPASESPLPVVCLVC